VLGEAFGVEDMALTEVSKRKVMSTQIVDQAFEQIVLQMMKLQTLISEICRRLFKNEIFEITRLVHAVLN